MKKRKIRLNGTLFTLGAKYKDAILGNEGIATAGITYLTGCDQLQIAFNDQTGRPVEMWIDVSNVISVVTEKKKKVRPVSGGPAPITKNNFTTK